MHPLHASIARCDRTTGKDCARFVVVAATIVLVGVVAARAFAGYAFEDFLLPAGDNPQSLSAADCDGNGTPDLVVANFGSGTVTIHPNLGGGAFGPAETVATVSSPAGAACTDFTGDGLYDLAVTSFTGDTVTIYQGEEAGGFTGIGSYGVGAGPRTVSVADFDGDGRRDLAVVNSQSDNVTFLYGNGTGGILGKITVNIQGVNSTNAPFAGTVDDFDDDGRPDLAIVSQGQPSLRILLNDLDLAPGPMPALPRSRGVAAGDVDGDGDPDLVVLSLDSAVQILLRDDDGALALDHSILVRPNARGLALADFDGDGLRDLAVAYNDSNSVEIIRATAPGQFPTAAAGTSETHNPLGALAARSTSGSDQVVYLERASRSLVALEPDAAGALASTILQTTVSPPQALLLADLTNDTILDAVVAAKVGRELSLEILPGVVASGFQAAASGAAACGDRLLEGAEVCDDGNTRKRDGCSASCQLELGRAVFSMSAEDMTGDGRRDLVVVDGRGQLLLLVGDGAARFSGVRRLSKVRAKTPAAVADFDGNGTPDVAYLPSRSREGAVAVLFNDGAGGFTHVAVVPAGRFRGPLLAGDADGNGFPDLVVLTQARPRGVTTLLNDGAGGMLITAASALPSGLTALAAADFDEDGRLDLLAEFKSRRQLPLVLRGLGGGAFAPGAAPSSTRFAGAMIFDVDHDLHRDIVVCDGGLSAPCRALYGDGAGGFSEVPGSPNDRIGSDLVAFAAADLDVPPDGVVDVVGVSRGDDRVVALFRSATGPEVTRVELGPSNRPNAVAIGDVNGDGTPDVVVTNEGTHDISRFRNLGGRTFTGGDVRFSTGGVKPRDLAVVDLNGSGPLDLVVVLEELDASPPANSGGGVALFVASQQGIFLSESFPTGGNPQALAVGPLNGDARPDIVTANLADHTLTVLLSTPVGWASTTLASGGSRPTDVALGDVDGDGDLDVLVANEDSATITVLLNDGDGGLAAPIASAPLGRDRPWSLCVGDFDLDGNRDLAVASVNTADVLLLRGRGDGTWHADARVFPTEKDPHPVACRDLDGDGLSDVLYARRATGRVDVITSLP